MNKTAIKNFAIWARNKLIADISYKAGLLGIKEKGIQSPLPQSTQTVQFFDIGTKEPSSITGVEIQQRKKLVEEIERKAKQSDYPTAYKNVIEEVAYTWFNRLIAIRFMEVNDYLPTRIRVLSSESKGKAEPDLVTHALEANLYYSAYEKDRIIQLKHENKLDELFRILFIKQCNALNAYLPELFEKTSDYTELLLNVSFTDKDGVVYHLINDILEDDFNVSKEGQVEIIGWLYQYYNTEPKDETFALLKKNVKITKERIPAATQLFTPDWIVRYMVENSLGRFWLEGHPNNELKANWKYYLDETEQEVDVRKQLEQIRKEYEILKPEDIKFIDPAMGSGHILVYAFDVLMQIYESHGYSQRDAAKSIVENNLYGLDIDNRAYQLAYFAVMMKARQYNRRILNGETKSHIYAIQESNNINRNQLKYFGAGLSEMEKNTARLQLLDLLDAFIDAKEYGSILNIENYNWELMVNFINIIDPDGQMSLDSIGIEQTKDHLVEFIKIGEIMAQKYGVVATNPPYMGNSGMNAKLAEFVKLNYPSTKSDLFSCFIEKNMKFSAKHGLISMITMESWMFLSSFEEIRNSIINNKTIENMTHMPYLGKGGTSLGINFGTTAFIIRNNKINRYCSTYNCVSYLDTNEDGVPFEFPVKNDKFAKQYQEDFNLIPGKPIGYWLSKQSFYNFSHMETLGEYIEPRIGLITGDNNRFLRCWFEIEYDKIGFGIRNNEESIESFKKWFPYQKGGDFRKWYGNMAYVVDWENDGYLMKNDNSDKGRVRSHNYNGNYSFIPCITWTSVTTGTFACRFSPAGFLFDAAGPICKIKSKDNLNIVLGLLSSCVARYYLSVINPTINFHPGYIMAIPFSLNRVIKYQDQINQLVSQNIDLSMAEWDNYELSWYFKRHPLINSGENMNLVSDFFKTWEVKTQADFDQLKSNEELINIIYTDIYELQHEVPIDVDDSCVTLRKADLKTDIRSLISYAVGCMFGRYSLDVDGLVYAGGQWDSRKYSTIIPDDDNIIPITDEEYFKDDIVGKFIDFVKAVYGEKNLEYNLKFIANALGNKGNNYRDNIRNYFMQDFFKDHCSTYSVTGAGKRPIYWLFDSGKQNGFKALVYMHRYDENTIGNLRIDYLHRMQRIYENEIARMQDTIENSRDAREVTAATKRKEKLIKQLQETKEYDEKIAHLALARTPIDLDDGVKVNYEKVQTDRDGKKLDVLAKI